MEYASHNSAAQRLRAMPEIRALAERHLVQPGHAAAISYGGVTGLNQAYIDVVRHDLKVFLPGLLLLLAESLFADWKLRKQSVPAEVIGNV